MAFTLTYSELQARLKSILQRKNDTLLDENLPMIIDLGERRVARELKSLVTRKVVTGAFNTGDHQLAKPARWLETISFMYGSGTGNTTRNTLFPRSAEFCKTYWPDLAATGLPEYYSDDDFDHWVVVRTPDADYPIEITYYERPEPLSDTVTTNTLTIKCPDLLLYACLLETPGILRTDERIPTWQSAYDRHLKAYNGEAKMRQTDASNNREAGI